jgi:CRP-like cAMP-binding protein
MTGFAGLSDPPPGTGRSRFAALRGLPFFAGLDEAAAAEAARTGWARRVRQGETLFHQDAEATGFHLLLDGRLKFVRTGSDGQRVVVFFVGPGEPASVLALLGPGQRYPASAVAVVDSAVLCWDGAALHRLARRHPGVALNAMRAMSERVHEAAARLGEMASERAERRLANALLRLVRQAGHREPDGAVRIDFPISRQDIAEMTGMTLHTASRVLSGWERSGILGEGGRQRVVVRSPRALARIAEG